MAVVSILRTVGYLLSARCACGHVEDELIQGCGMAGPHTCRDLAPCTRCSRFVNVASDTPKPRCPRCKSPVIVVDLSHRDEDEATGEESFGPVVCPACGKAEAQLLLCGLWD